MKLTSKLLIGIVLLGLGQLLIGITEFNLRYAFADPGPGNIEQWWTLAQRHSEQLFAAIVPVARPWSLGGLIIAAIFCFPPLIIVLWPGAHKIHIILLATLALLLVLDADDLINVSTSGAEYRGCDGPDGASFSIFHWMLGALCVVVMALRWLWLGASSFGKWWAKLARDAGRQS